MSRKGSLEGRCALITGATGGLGEAIARSFADCGAELVIHGRDETRARVLQQSLPGGTRVALADLSTPAGAAHLAEQVEETGRRVDILINCAGGDGERTKRWFDVTPQEWAHMYATEVIAPAMLAAAFAPAMCEQRWGRIIQVSAALALRPLPIGPHYAAAKAAQHSLTVSLSKELGPFGVTVNTLLPGSFRTAASETTLRGFAQARGWGTAWDEIEARFIGEVVQGVPIGRMGRPGEFAECAAFLASDAASYVTGTALRVDGGAIGLL